MSRLAPPQLSFADLELRNQGVHLDPLLQGILAFLDDHATLVEQVRQDLTRGLKNPATGRDGITPAQTLRSLILMRVKNWDYRELRERINDGHTLRTFTDFDSHRVPKHDAFNRAFNRLTPATMQAINQVVVQTAIQLGLEDGKQLRVDTTVVETNIHFRMSSERLVYSAGVNPVGAKVRSPVAWIVRRKETESRKPIDKAIAGW
jgi:IS5 family transposase